MGESFSAALDGGPAIVSSKRLSLTFSKRRPTEYHTTEEHPEKELKVPRGGDKRKIKKGQTLME